MSEPELSVGTVVCSQTGGDGGSKYGLVVQGTQGAEVEWLDGSRVPLAEMPRDQLRAMPQDGLIALYLESGKLEGKVAKTDPHELAQRTLRDLGGSSDRRNAKLHLALVLTGELLQKTQVKVLRALPEVASEGAPAPGSANKTPPLSAGAIIGAAGVESAAPEAAGGGQGPEGTNVLDRGMVVGAPEGSDVRNARHVPTPHRPEQDAPEAGRETSPRHATGRSQTSLRGAAREYVTLQQELEALLDELAAARHSPGELERLEDDELAELLAAVADRKGGEELALALAHCVLTKTGKSSPNSGVLGTAVRVVWNRSGLQGIADAIADLVVSEPTRGKLRFQQVQRHLSALAPDVGTQALALGIIRTLSGRAHTAPRKAKHLDQLSAFVGSLLDLGEVRDAGQLARVLAVTPGEPASGCVPAVLEACVAHLGISESLAAVRSLGDDYLELYEWLLEHANPSAVRDCFVRELFEALAHVQIAHARCVAIRRMGMLDALSRMALVQVFRLSSGADLAVDEEIRQLLLDEVSAVAASSDPVEDSLLVSAMRAAHQTGAAIERRVMHEHLRAVEAERGAASTALQQAGAELDQLRETMAVLQGRVDELQQRDTQSAKISIARTAIDLLDTVDALLSTGHIDHALVRARDALVETLHLQGVEVDGQPGESPADAWLQQGLYRPPDGRGRSDALVISRRAFATRTPEGKLLQVREGWLEVRPSALA